MAASYSWSTVLTPWLLVQDGAILTASPVVHLQKLEAEKTLVFLQLSRSKCSQNCAIFQDAPFILLFSNCIVNFCLINSFSLTENCLFVSRLVSHQLVF